MFDIKKIKQNPNTKQWTCSCKCDSPQDAESICANYINKARIIANEFEAVADLHSKGSTVTIEASNEITVFKIANFINANAFMPPLDVYVFYGTHGINFPNMWCVGFDFPDSSRLINSLSMYNKTVIADNNPQNWQDKNGKTYSVVIPTGQKDKSPTGKEAKLLDQRINLFLAAIQNTTFRKTKPITIQ